MRKAVLITAVVAGASLKAVPKKLPLRGVSQFQGHTVTALRPFKKAVQEAPESFIRQEMIKKGRAGRIKGDVVHIHHLERNPEGPLVLIPARFHRRWNRRQHPDDGAGLTKRQRKEFDTWRANFWRAQGCQELARRGLPTPRLCRSFL